MTTFAATATKTNQPLQLFTMFPPGGASTLKGFAAPAAFGTTTTTTTAATAGGSDPLRIHHFRGSQSMHGDEDGNGSGVDPGLPPALFADGPTPHPPLRPVRHVQHATQWAESKTTVAPGLIVRSTTASVNTTQWSEYSTTVTEDRVFHGRSSSSTQFQTIRSNSGPSAAPNSSVMTSAQYLDDLQLPTQQLDLAAQLGKGSIARKGSLGGRRPPTIRYRRVNSQGSLPYEEQQQLLQQHQQQQLSGMMAHPTGSSAPSMNGTESIRSGRSRTPPPRPPPPVFRQQQQQQPPKPLDQQQQQPVPVTAAVTLQLPPQTDWNCSRSGTPPSLPANSPPPLPDREDLDFVMDEVSSSASLSSSSPSPIPGMTDVVEINDKESVGEDGEVVRRRTIITLGPRVVVVGTAPSAAGGAEGSFSSINITLLNGGPVISSQSNDSKATTTEHHQAVAACPDDTPQRANARASAYNARRTIEQRRQQQQQLQQQQQEDEQEEEEEDEIQEPEQVQREQSPAPVVVTKTPPASTYLYGEKGSPASSFGGSSLRTMSISMSFDDLDETNSNASMTEQQRMRSGGRNRSEAWYERRQSYGFEAADKLQSLLNTSGSSDVPSITGTAVSRSCDSLCSTVRSTSSAIEKMIPPWIKNPSPKQAEEETGKSPTGSSRLSYFAQSIDDVSADDESEEDHLTDAVCESGTPSSVATEHNKTTAQPRRTPTPTSVQRSESSRSATNVLEEAEPIWLRDLRVRRSLRDGRRKPPVIKSPPPIETPVWLGVKLRPTGLSLIDPDPSAGPTCSTSHLPSPTKPHNYTPIFTFTNTSTTSKIQQHLRNSRENLLASAQSSPEPARKDSEEKPPAPAVMTTLKVSVSSLASSNESREELANHQTVIESCHNNNTTTFRVVPANKANAKPVPSSSIVIVNSSRESLHSIGTADNASSFSCETGNNKLNHHKSIELMRMLEETPLVSTNGVPLRHDRMDSASGVNTETGSVYSMGDWTECSSTIASVKNSNEDLTQINQTEGQRKAKKVAFGADVKEESDQKRSRPRRIRSRSPESRLREWQERLEEVKSTIIHHHQTATVNQHPEFGVGICISAPTSGGLPLRMFGDDIKDTIQQQPESSASTNHFASQSSPTSDTFRSLLQPRKPYTITPTAVVHPAVTTPVVKESVVIDSYPPMMKAYSTAPPAEVSPSRPTPMVIRNGIVNFDSSVERKIVILEEKETIPAPKSILKKRSVENLLDLDRNSEPVIRAAVIPVIPAVIPVIPVQVVTGSQSVHSGITVSMTNQKKEPPPEQQEILPWRIHLKHVEQPPTINSVAIQQQPQPEVVVPPWRIELNRKKTPPFVPRASTPENFFSRGRSPASSESSATSIPGMSAAELIRNLRPNPVMMVARCEVRESVFRPPSNSIEPEAETIVPPESDPLSVRTDHGYHSLEPEAESSLIKRHHSSSARQQTTVDETKTIDETIAQLNETIEEIRSLDRTETTEFDRNAIHSIPVEVVVAPKVMDFTPAASSSSPAKNHEKPCAPPAGLVHSKSASKLPENRFVVREIRPCSAVQDSRSYFHSTTSSKETTLHHSTVTSNRRDSVEAEGPEAKAASANAQLQRLRETTKLLADGHPQLRADPTLSTSRLMQTNESSNHNRSSSTNNTSHKNQNGDVTTPTAMMTPVKLLASPEQKGRLSFVMASGVEDDDVTAHPTIPTIPVVHHKPVEVPELADSSVEELLSRFEKSADDVLPDPPLIRKSSSATSMTSSTFNSRSSTTTTNQLRTTQFTKQVKKSSVTAPLAVGMNKPLPAKRSNSIELTSGMPEEKAALLVRKFFGNSVIETKKSRMAKTETIMEESSELGFSSSFSEEKSLLEVAVETFSSPTPPPPAEDPSFLDCDDFFHRPSSETEGMSTSSFGSVLDVMTDTTTDDERSNRTTSSMTMTNTSRYSSCSERSVKLSDIINRQDRPSLLDLVPSSSAVTPLMDEYSCATSESASIAISLCQTTTDSSSTGSAFSRSGSSSIRRNKTQRHPTVIRKDKSGVPAVSVKSSIRSPTSKSRGGASTPSRGSHHRSCTASPSTSSTPGVRRRSNGSSSVKSTGDPVKTVPSVTRSSKSASSLAAAPVRPPRALQQVNQSTEVKRRSLRTSTSGSTLRNATAASSAKAPAAASASRRSPAPPVDRKTSVPSGGVPLANRTNRLVTITSYKSRNSASAKPDEISAVSGIKVTPVAVGSGHYKIRMDQRIAAAATEKASKTSTQKISTSQRTTGTKTSTTSEKRSTTTTTSSSRNSTLKQQSDK